VTSYLPSTVSHGQDQHTCKGHGQGQSVGLRDRVDTNERMDGGDSITSHAVGNKHHVLQWPISVLCVLMLHILGHIQSTVD